MTDKIQRALDVYALGMEPPGMTTHPCDLCGATNPFLIEVTKRYTQGVGIHVCPRCGLVYIPERRSSEEVAADWSRVYSDPKGYQPTAPAYAARLFYVFATLEKEVGFHRKSVLDLACGDGRFLEFVRGAHPGRILGVEPVLSQCQAIRDAYPNVPYVHSRIEDLQSPSFLPFDIITINWALENCAEPRDVVNKARSLLHDDGVFVVATGSRILVPFKKPLGSYLSIGPNDSLDTHPTRWSVNTLHAFLLSCGFEPVWTNRYLDSDVLMVISKKTGLRVPRFPADSPPRVVDFFGRWDKESREWFGKELSDVQKQNQPAGP